MAKRRRFVVLLSGALSTTLLLTGCLGNPPNRHGGTASGAFTKVPVAANNADLEVKTVSLGYIPILEAAPLVVGSRKASSPGMAWRSISASSPAGVPPATTWCWAAPAVALMAASGNCRCPR